MKKLLFLLAFIPLVFACNQYKKNDLDKSNLNGKVKSLRKNTYTAVVKFGEITKDKIKYSAFTSWNEEGNQIENAVYDKDGNLRWKDINKYDEKGNLIEIAHYNKDGDLERKNKFKYDEKGNEIKRNFFNSDGDFTGYIIFKYDDKGNEIELNRSSKGKTIKKYDDKGNEIELRDYSSDGSLSVIFIKKYDDKGNLVENVEEYFGDGDYKDYKKWIMKYDDKGNRIENIFYNENGDEKSKYISKYKYDNRGNISEIKTQKYTSGSLFYDVQKDDFVSGLGLDEEDVVKFTYDKYNNWIKEIELMIDEKKEIPEVITERNIEYYQ